MVEIAKVPFPALTGMLLVLGGCADPPGGRDPTEYRLTVWAHAGREAERRTPEDQVERFNAEQNEVAAELTILPEGSYNGQIQAAALAGGLPDVLEFDGPYLYNYAWQGKLLPIERLLPPALLADLLPSIIAQGTYRGTLYTVGTFDSGLGLYGRRDRLAAAGMRIPASPADAWTAGEFTSALAALSARDADGAVLDLKLNYSGEWFAYGFSPALQSAGGDLIDRQSYASASGVLNGRQSIGALRRLQRWIRDGYVDPNLDDAAFTEARVALSWVGHWEYERYRQAAGDNLVLLPLPDFGTGSRTGQGSWNWGITVNCPNPEAASRFLEFLLRPAEVLLMTETNGAVPATRSAIARSDRYGPEGPLALFVAQLAGGYAVPRPRTAAYPVISASFAKAFRNMRSGADVQGALDKAARAIDQDLADNRYYR